MGFDINVYSTQNGENVYEICNSNISYNFSVFKDIFYIRDYDKKQVSKLLDGLACGIKILESMDVQSTFIDSSGFLYSEKFGYQSGWERNLPNFKYILEKIKKSLEKYRDTKYYISLC